MRAIIYFLIISLFGLICVACESAESEEMTQVDTDQGGGADNVGADHAGSDHAGADNAGADNAGADNAGADNAGADNAGADNAGAMLTGGALIGGESAGVDDGLTCVDDRDCSSLDEGHEHIEATPPRCEGEIWIELRHDSSCVEGLCVSHLEVETDCAAQGYRCKPEVGCVDAPECIDIFECPPPPPVAIVDCDGDVSVNVLYTPTCSEEGLCGFEERYDPIRDCSLDQRTCLEGECVATEK